MIVDPLNGWSLVHWMIPAESEKTGYRVEHIIINSVVINTTAIGKTAVSNPA
jgi:hypothetical protein